jgi:hypothetical protein
LPHCARPRGAHVLSRLTSALVRGILVALMVVTPSLVLPTVNPDTAEIVALIAIFAAVLTTIEYAATYPSIVEFRDAPPFNRIRFLSLLISVILISIVCRGETHTSAISVFVQAIGALIGHVIDLPYSPVRLVVHMLHENASQAEIDLVRSAAGLSYLISLLSLLAFIAVLRLGGWPRGLAGFNVWINLPTFDPSAGSDVVERLNRDARANIALGLLLPFLIPIAVKAGTALFEPVQFGSSHTLIWTITAWAFLPASLFMRGIAMRRVADMIAERRRKGQQPVGHMVPA